MKKIVLLLLSTLLLLGGCTKKPPKTEVELQKFNNMSFTAGFDTFLSLTAYSASQEDFDKLMEKAIQEFKRYNDYFDIYNLYDGINNIKTVNDNAGIAPVKVDPVLIECLLDAKEFYELSQYEFDITIGAVLKVWHNYREEAELLAEKGEYGKVPTVEELDAAKACTGWEYVEIDEEKNTVYINNPCVSLDIGGIAKGFAAEKIAQSMENDVYAGIVNAGGNNRTMNTKPDKSDWVSGVQNPNGDGSLLAIPVKGSQSIVTSGDYQRYYVAEDGIIYHHIIDPKTNFPADHYRSVSIITKDSGDADALSTTLFTLSIEEGKEVLNQYNAAHPDTPASAIWIMNKDKAVEDANGFETTDFYVTSTDDLKGTIQLIK